MKRRSGAPDDGFTLIELMVVVLIIAILLAIAIPTFLGVRQRANDRATQTALRNGLTNELVVYTDQSGFSQDLSVLQAADASLHYVAADLSALASHDIVYVHVFDTVSTNDTVILGAHSRSGRCYWIRNVGDRDFPRFASNDCASEPTAFTDEWQ